MFSSSTGDAKPHFLSEPRLSYAENQSAVLEKADALLIVTEWKEFRSPDFDSMKQKLNSPLVFDGRNLFEPAEMRLGGFIRVRARQGFFRTRVV
ncbi:MAG: UDP binding domain-containing protein [Sulfuricellaceae bacterium]|nr:UDP binding domain-containing protein [Sulfuricellaceae bacterium]